MQNEKTIEVLNKLITINNDRIEGYETATKETEESDLKTLFARLISTSEKCNQELKAEVINLGGTPAEGTRVSGKFFRVWMDVKAALTGKDRKFIINSCEYGEDVAKETYEKVLDEDAEHLNAELRDMVEEQHALLVADHDEIRLMKEAAEQD